MVALLVNTVYFKAEWTDPFDPADIAIVDFQRADGSAVGVPMMRQALDGLRGEARTEIRLPRFELTYDRVLNDVLKEMGMEVAFDARRADFGWLLGNAGPGSAPHIGWMKQKSFLKVDEEGTETAAVTGTAFSVSDAPVLQADRPFLFVIRERISGAILFVGTVSDPTTE